MTWLYVVREACRRSLRFHLDQESGEELGLPAANQWVCGQNAGDFVTRRRPATCQAQIFMVNVYLNLRKLSNGQLLAICSTLPSADPKAGWVNLFCVRSTSRRSPAQIKPYSLRAAAAILGVPAGTLITIFQRVRSNGWAPVEPAVRDVATPQLRGSKRPWREQNVDILRTLVREAVHVSAKGLPDIEYIHAVCRLALNGVPVGDKYCSSNFVELVEVLSAKYLELADAEVLCSMLPGLGVASPLTILFDMVNLSGGMFSRAETLQVILLHALSPSCGRLEPFLVSTPSADLDHSGVAQAQAVGRALTEHAASLSTEALCQRLVAAIAGDGAVVGKGGQHGTTAAAEKLWPQVTHNGSEDAACVEWDKWHRCNVAFEKALQASPMAQELYCVSRALSSWAHMWVSSVVWSRR